MVTLRSSAEQPIAADSYRDKPPLPMPFPTPQRKASSKE